MKRISCLILLVALAASAPVLAKTEITTATTTADCDGWSTEVLVTWRTNLPVPVAGADLRVQFVVTDGAGAELAVIDHTEALVRVGENESDLFTVGAPWSAELCGELTLTGEMRLSSTFDEGLGPSIEEDFADVAASFFCDCGSGGEDFECRLGAGYWKNHDWPVDSLEFLGTDTPRDELVDIMRMPVRGDATISLAFHLIAAKVNVANGADDAIAPTIAAAEDLIAMVGLGGEPSGEDRHDALMLKDELEAYNEGECEPVMIDDGGDDPAKSLDAETTPWGTVKSLFR